MKSTDLIEVMSEALADEKATSPTTPGWKELWSKEDWWAVWLGLGAVISAYAFFARGSTIAWLAGAPAKWSTLSQLGGQLAADVVRYIVRFIVFLALLTFSASFIGRKPKAFVPVADHFRGRQLGPLNRSRNSANPEL